MTSRAMLLIGPTGSGKTPLGEAIEAGGVDGLRCVHFDFGLHLRRAADGGAGLLGDDEAAFVREMLEANRLLEDEHFHIAEKLLRAFLADRCVASGDLVILNGLPRHVEQARRVDSIVNVRAVAHLARTDETVLRRIRSNAGGDRGGRRDDSIEGVRNKLAIFAARTAPLIDHYRMRGADVYELPITAATSAQDALVMLVRAWS